MVEININVRRSSICWRGRRELITDVRNQKSWLWRHCRRRAIYRLLRSPSQTCHAKPKTQINKYAGRYQLLSRWWMPTVSSLAWKTFRKLRDAVALQIAMPALYLWLIAGYPSGNRPLQQYLGFTAGRWLWSVRACAGQPIAPKKRRNGQRDWWASRVTAIISALVICIYVCLSWAVNHYRDNAITYKAQRDKKCQRTEAGECGNYWRLCQRDVAALDAKYTVRS